MNCRPTFHESILKEEKIMKFLSIYKSSRPEGVPPTQKEMEEMGKYVEKMLKSGVVLATEGCLPSALGAKLRLSNGKFSVTDGPFTESKEWIAGFDIVDCADLDQAVDYASRHPMARSGRIEIRPFWPMD